MRHLSSWFIGLVLLGLFLVETACNADQLAEPPPLEICDTLQVAYTIQVQEIIDINCAFAGCHVSGSSVPGNFTTYTSMEPFLNEQSFERFVIDMRSDPVLGMPPDVNNPGPLDLTDGDLDIIRCWIQNGYPEN